MSDALDSARKNLARLDAIPFEYQPDTIEYYGQIPRYLTPFSIEATVQKIFSQLAEANEEANILYPDLSAEEAAFYLREERRKDFHMNAASAAFGFLTDKGPEDDYASCADIQKYAENIKAHLKYAGATARFLFPHYPLQQAEQALDRLERDCYRHQARKLFGFLEERKTNTPRSVQDLICEALMAGGWTYADLDPNFNPKDKKPDQVNQYAQAMEKYVNIAAVSYVKPKDTENITEAFINLVEIGELALVERAFKNRIAPKDLNASVRRPGERYLTNAFSMACGRAYDNPRDPRFTDVKEYLRKKGGIQPPNHNL